MSSSKAQKLDKKLKKHYTSSAKPHTILLLGQSGSGKTTMLNLLGNLNLLGADDAQLRENLRKIKPICLTGAQYECKDAMKSATQKPGVYHISLAQGIDFIVIDTPGVGDTRGEGMDQKNTHAIMEAIKAEGYLNCVMLVISGTIARLDPQFSYVLSELAGMMPKEIMANITVFFTNSENEKDCTFKREGGLTVLEERGVVNPKCYYINNPYPLVESICSKAEGGGAGYPGAAAGDKGSDSDDIEDEDDDTDFAMLKGRIASAFKTLTNAFEAMATMQKIPTSEFLKLYQVRLDIETHCQSVQSKLHTLQFTVDEITKAQEALRSGGVVEEKIIVEEWEYVKMQDSGLDIYPQLPQSWSCMHPGCHCNCGTTEIGTLPPDHFLVAWLADKQKVLPDLIKEFRSQSVEEFFVNSQFYPFRDYMEECPVCKHHYEYHQCMPCQWVKKPTETVITHDASVELAAQLRMLEEEKVRIGVEIKEEQRKLGLAVAAQEEYGLWGNCLRSLEIKLKRVQQELKTKEKQKLDLDPDLMRLEAEYKAKIELIEKLHTFQLSYYRKAYECAHAVATPDEAYTVIEEFLKTFLIAQGSNAVMIPTFMIDLRKEVNGWISTNPGVTVTAALVCLLTWTSFDPLISYLAFGNKEYCFLQNDAMRNDLQLRGKHVMEHLARITKAVDNEYLVGGGTPLPANAEGWRGLSMPLEELQENFKVGVQYRVPFQLAFSLSQSITSNFLNRASRSDGKVLVEINLKFDWTNNPPCLNVCLLPYSLANGEQELLFQAYSWFKVMADPVYDPARDVWKLEIQAGYSNKDRGTSGLPLFYWH